VMNDEQNNQENHNIIWSFGQSDSNHSDDTYFPGCNDIT